MSHPTITRFQERLRILFDEVDDYLEEKYQGQFSLHPNRPQRGSTANKNHDGLFNVGSKFTAGYHSKYGRGYAIDLRICTLNFIDAEFRQKITEEITVIIDQKLKSHFPEQMLEVRQDLHSLKIIGNLTLGNP